MTNKQWKDCLSEAMNDLIPNTPFETIAAGMPAPAAATPVSVSRTHRVRRYVAAVAAAAVMVAGVGTWWYTRPEEKPPVTPATDDDAVTTTVTTAPTEQDVTTTTTTVDTPTTDGGIVTPSTSVTTVAPTQTTTKPTTGKTDPTKTTTTTTTTKKTASTTAADRMLIYADESDNTMSDVTDQGTSVGSGGNAMSPLLKKMMKQYSYYTNAVYAVIVDIPLTQRDKDSYWESTEELVQFCKEYDEVYKAFHEEALRLNPDYGGHVSKITVWTDTMQTNYDRWRELYEEKQRLDKVSKSDYYRACMEKRYEELAAVYGDEPFAVSIKQDSSTGMAYYSYYVELTAEQINTLAAKGGYRFRLSIPMDVLLQLWGWEEEFM